MSGQDDTKTVVHVHERGSDGNIMLCLVVWLVWMGYGGRAWDSVVNHVVCLGDKRPYRVCLDDERLKDLSITIVDSLNAIAERDSLASLLIAHTPRTVFGDTSMGIRRDHIASGELVVTPRGEWRAPRASP